MCIMQKKTFYSMHTLPIVEVNKCLLEHKLILCLEKKILWNLRLIQTNVKETEGNQHT